MDQKQTCLSLVHTAQSIVFLRQALRHPMSVQVRHDIVDSLYYLVASLRDLHKFDPGETLQEAQACLAVLLERYKQAS